MDDQEREIRELERLLAEVRDRARRFRLEAERQRELARNLGAWAVRAYAVLCEIRAGVCSNERIGAVVRACPAAVTDASLADMGHP